MIQALVLVLAAVGGVSAQTTSQPQPPMQQQVDRHFEFTYDMDNSNPFGVQLWPQTYSENCNGQRQSPVDIRTDHVRYVRHRCMRVNYFNRIVKGTLKNTGLASKLKPKNREAVQMTDVPNQSGIYNFHNFHVHHGGTRDRRVDPTPGKTAIFAGAEHTVNGHRFDGEVHLVFYNKKYGSLVEASHYADGLTVIAIFVRIVPEDKLLDRRFANFVEQNIPQIYGYKSKIETELDISMFLERDCEFYTYHGSLTTPLCNETVTWIVLRNPIEVTRRAWTHFGSLKSRGGHVEQYGNYRVTMPVNGRTIEANFMQTDQSKPSSSQKREQPMVSSNIPDNQSLSITPNQQVRPKANLANQSPKQSEVLVEQKSRQLNPLSVQTFNQPSNQHLGGQSRTTVPTAVNRNMPGRQTLSRRPRPRGVFTSRGTSISESARRTSRQMLPRRGSRRGRYRGLQRTRQPTGRDFRGPHLYSPKASIQILTQNPRPYLRTPIGDHVLPRPSPRLTPRRPLAPKFAQLPFDDVMPPSYEAADNLFPFPMSGMAAPYAPKMVPRSPSRMTKYINMDGVGNVLSKSILLDDRYLAVI